MKNLIILSFALLLMQGKVYSQFYSSCLPEGITFTSQSQIDSFQVNYPGCTEIEGDLVIWSDNVTNLNGLSALTSIGGNLLIDGGWEGGAGLNSLSGLDSLASIGGNLSITWTELNDLSGLNNLVSLGGDIIIGGNSSMISLAGLEGMTSVSGSIILYTYGDNYIHGNNIQNLTGLDNLTSIGGDLGISGNFGLHDLSGLNGLITANNLILGRGKSNWGVGTSLVNLNGLENLTTITGELFIDNSYSLSSIEGIENLNTIEGHITIAQTGLSDFSGSSSLSTIGGNFTIKDNAGLTSLAGLDNLASIGGDLTITGNPALSEFEEDYFCEYLSNPNGSVNIYNNASGCNNPVEAANSCGIILPCLPYGNYYFFAQADIDDFESNYPGCYYLGGDATIKGPNISSLSGLDQVTSVSGNLVIGETSAYQGTNPLLTSLEGLESIIQIGGDLILKKNDSLSSLAGLENITTVGGDFSLIKNGVLEGLSDLGSLTSIGGNLTLIDNPIIDSLTGLDELASIGGNLVIEYNDSLISLSGLESLTTIGGGLSINGDWNGLLADLHGLESLNSIGADLNINNCDFITNFIGLENLQTIGGSFTIDNNPSLTSLIGLENLNVIGGNLAIGIWEGHPNLASISGLQNLDSIGGYLAIRKNDDLTSLAGLENIAPGSITNLSITENPWLSDCDAESICSYLASPNGEVVIMNNNDGCNSPFQVATECGTTLPCLPFGHYIFASQADIDYFENYMDCTELQGTVYINGGNISNLEGLANVSSIGGELHIISNPILTTLNGLDNIDAGSIASLFINYNSSLTECEVTSVCDYLLDPHGSYSIDINGPGCNSPEEVMEACAGVGVEESSVVSHQSSVVCYPNPTGGIVDFRISNFDFRWVLLKIYDVWGREVAVVLDGKWSGDQVVRWDAGALPAGIYYYQLRAKGVGQVGAGKIVKY